MDRRIENLKSTTFFGQRLTRKRIAFIQETVSLLPHLARSELGMTLWEQLHWKTPQGSSRIQFALSVLEELERLSSLTLPPKRTSGRGPQKPLQRCSLTDPQPAIEGPLVDLTPLKLQLASSVEHVAAWNAWVQRYHPLGYRRPLGPHLRYFLRDRGTSASWAACCSASPPAAWRAATPGSAGGARRTASTST